MSDPRLRTVLSLPFWLWAAVMPSLATAHPIPQEGLRPAWTLDREFEFWFGDRASSMRETSRLQETFPSQLLDVSFRAATGDTAEFDYLRKQWFSQIAQSLAKRSHRLAPLEKNLAQWEEHLANEKSHLHEQAAKAVHDIASTLVVDDHLALADSQLRTGTSLAGAFAELYADFSAEIDGFEDLARERRISRTEGLAQTAQNARKELTELQERSRGPFGNDSTRRLLSLQQSMTRRLLEIDSQLKEIDHATASGSQYAEIQRLLEQTWLFIRDGEPSLLGEAIAQAPLRESEGVDYVWLTAPGSPGRRAIEEFEDRARQRVGELEVSKGRTRAVISEVTAGPGGRFAFRLEWPFNPEKPFTRDLDPTLYDRLKATGLVGIEDSLDSWPPYDGIVVGSESHASLRLTDRTYTDEHVWGFDEDGGLYVTSRPSKQDLIGLLLRIRSLDSSTFPVESVQHYLPSEEIAWSAAASHGPVRTNVVPTEAPILPLSGGGFLFTSTDGQTVEQIWESKAGQAALFLEFPQSTGAKGRGRAGASESSWKNAKLPVPFIASLPPEIQGFEFQYTLDACAERRVLLVQAKATAFLDGRFKGYSRASVLVFEDGTWRLLLSTGDSVPRLGVVTKFDPRRRAALERGGVFRNWGIARDGTVLVHAEIDGRGLVPLVIDRSGARALPNTATKPHVVMTRDGFVAGSTAMDPADDRSNGSLARLTHFGDLREGATRAVDGLWEVFASATCGILEQDPTGSLALHSPDGKKMILARDQEFIFSNATRRVSNCRDLTLSCTGDGLIARVELENAGSVDSAGDPNGEYLMIRLARHAATATIPSK